MIPWANVLNVGQRSILPNLYHWEVNQAAVREMHRQVGDLALDENGLARRGLLVRHLVLPGDLANTETVLAFLAWEISTDTYLNLMDQYHPCYKAFEEPSLDRPFAREELRAGATAARPTAALAGVRASLIPERKYRNR